jgi:hypothetical protein
MSHLKLTLFLFLREESLLMLEKPSQLMEKKKD